MLMNGRIKSRNTILLSGTGYGSLWLSLLFVLLMPLSGSNAQDSDCGNVSNSCDVFDPVRLIFEYNDCRKSTGRPLMVVRTDPNARINNFLCQEMFSTDSIDITPGLYLLQPVIDYSGSEQINESYYFEVERGSWTHGPVNSVNIADRFVVTDTLNTRDQAFSAKRNSGVFYLDRNSTLFFKHYKVLAEQLGESSLVNCRDAAGDIGNCASFDQPESVDLVSLQLTPLENEATLQLTPGNSRKQIEIGPDGVYEERLTLTNIHREFTARNIRIITYLPESVTFDATNIHPRSITDTEIVWEIPVIAPGQQIIFSNRLIINDIELRQRVNLVTSRFVTSSIGDISVTDSVDVRLAECPEQYDVELTAGVSQDSVITGEQFDYTLTVKNSGPGAAEDLLVVCAVPGAIDQSLQETDSIYISADTLYWFPPVLASGDSSGLDFEASVTAAFDKSETPVLLETVCILYSDCDSDPDNDVMRIAIYCDSPPEETEPVSEKDIVEPDRLVFEPDRRDRQGREPPMFISVLSEPPADIKLEILDITGYRVKLITAGGSASNSHTTAFAWDGTADDGLKVGSGVYFLACRVVAGDGKLREQIKKIIVVR
jgi:hypothetical protein